VIVQSGHHAGGVTLASTLSRPPRLPAVIEIGGEHCKCRVKVVELLGKAVPKPIQPLKAQPLRSFEPRDAAGEKRYCLGLTRKMSRYIAFTR
jgi:hypothetical protein